MNMKITELNKMFDEILTDEVKKVIMEQIYTKQVVEDNENSMDIINGFQTLSGLIDKISSVENIGNGNFGIIINIAGVTEDDLINCCGGSSYDEAQTKLMQGLHHDLEDSGIGKKFDIEIDPQGDENSLNLKIKITTNDDELSGDIDMKEITKDTNPTVDKKKDVILGGNSEEINESTGKRIIRLNEKDMRDLLKRIIKEATEPTMDPVTEKAIHDSGKENADYLKMVEKKIKDYLSFKGNDNPEFPNQIGQGEEKEARKNTEEQDEIVDDNRGRGPQDLDYDTDGVDDNGEPAKKFRDRMEKALTGDSTMGNADGLNAIKTKTGEKIVKNIKRRHDNLRKEPIYPKEAVPVDTKPETKLGRPVNEQIEKMMRLSSYNKKTQ